MKKLQSQKTIQVFSYFNMASHLLLPMRAATFATEIKTNKI